MWIFLEIYQIHYVFLEWTVIFLFLIRGITIFRIIDGTKYYIRLISESLLDIKSFLIMLFYSTFSFGILFMKSKEKIASFKNIWIDAYSLNFGENQVLGNNKGFNLEYAVYLVATIFGVILMLNLLIQF